MGRPRRIAALLISVITLWALLAPMEALADDTSPASTGSIAGFVVGDDDRQLEHATVTAMAVEDGQLVATSSTSSGHNGAFDLTELEPGTYYLCGVDETEGFAGYHPSGACNPNADVAGLEPIVVTAGQVSHPSYASRLTLAHWLTAQFSFVDGLSGQPVDGDVQVRMFRSGTDELAVPPFNPNTDALPRLEQGSYDVEVIAAGYPAQWLDMWAAPTEWIGEPSVADSTPVDVNWTAIPWSYPVKLYQDGDFRLNVLSASFNWSHPQVGVTFSTYVPDWLTPKPDTLSFQWRLDGVPIAGATTSSYTPTPTDVGHSLDLVISETLAGYEPASSISGEYTVLAGQITTNGLNPTVTGSPDVGNVLTAHQDGWQPTNLNFSYTWLVNGNALVGTTGPKLQLTPALLGATIQVSSTGSAPGYASMTSAGTSPAVTVVCGRFVSSTPTIAGSARVGATLVAQPGSWSPGTTLQYEWFAGGNYIPGATGARYTIAPAYLGKPISVLVTGTIEKCSYVGRYSAATKPAAIGTLTAPSPTISGTAAVGQTLRATPGAWTSGTSLSYQWYASGSVISKATGSTVKLAAAQKGKTITVRVTGKKIGYASAAKTSKATGKVTAGLITGPTPTITGTAQVGKALAVKPGTWSAGATLKYQWYVGGTAIAGATKTSYTVSPSYLGRTLSVRVTGTRSGYSGSVKASKATAAVKPGILATAAPAISGLVAVGQTLTANPGTWTSGTSFSYQWLANGAAISGATAKTLKLADAQHGATISVKVIGAKTAYTTASRTSAVTGKVTAGVASGPKPTISGSAKVAATLKANAGSWTNATTLSYQWYANGAAISGAKSTSLTLTTAQYQKTITVRVMGAKSDYTATTQTSAATAKVAPGTLTGTTPAISGTLLVGKTLSASHSGWTAGARLSYQWYRGSTAIKGATGASYRLVAADAPNTVKVKVTGKKTDFTTLAKTSAATGRVSPGNTVNCSSFATHAQAQAWFNKYYPYFGDVGELDSDNDRNACETLK